MESIKRKWGKPGLDVQVFMPNEYIAACDPDATYVTYDFWCDAGDADYHVYWENGTNVFPNNTWSYSPCNQTHSVTVPKGQSIDDVFPKGYIVKVEGVYDWWGRFIEWKEVGSPQNVRIWRPNPSDNKQTHCTFQLNENEYTVHNPS